MGGKSDRMDDASLSWRFLDEGMALLWISLDGILIKYCGMWEIVGFLNYLSRTRSTATL